MDKTSSLDPAPLFSERDVTIDRSKLRIGPKTWPLEALTRLEKELPSSQLPPSKFLIGGAIALLLAYVLGGFLGFLLFIAGVGANVWWFLTQRPYGLIIRREDGTESVGEWRGLDATHFVDQVVEKIEDAKWRAGIRRNILTRERPFAKFGPATEQHLENLRRAFDSSNGSDGIGELARAALDEVYALAPDAQANEAGAYVVELFQITKDRRTGALKEDDASRLARAQEGQNIYEQGLRLLESDDGDTKLEGLKLVHRATELDPNHVEALLTLGKALFFLDKNDETHERLRLALHCGTRAIELSPDNTRAANLLGAIHFRRGKLSFDGERWSEAFDALRESLIVEPNSLPALALLEVAADKAGREGDLKDVIVGLSGRAPPFDATRKLSSSAEEQLEIARERGRNGKWTDAFEHSAKSLEAEASVDAWLMLRVAAHHSDRMDEAHSIKMRILSSFVEDSSEPERAKAEAEVPVREATTISPPPSISTTRTVGGIHQRTSPEIPKMTASAATRTAPLENQRVPPQQSAPPEPRVAAAAHDARIRAPKGSRVVKEEHRDLASIVFSKFTIMGASVVVLILAVVAGVRHFEPANRPRSADGAIQPQASVPVRKPDTPAPAVGAKPQPTAVAPTQPTPDPAQLAMQPPVPMARDAISGCHVWKPNFQPNETVRWTGNCVAILADGSGKAEWFADDKAILTYEGSFKAGMLQGFGRMSAAGGDRYEGEYRDGLRDGRGMYLSASGERYEGMWRNNRRDGSGVLAYANGDRYEGEFRDNKRHGQGVYTKPDGERYQGQYVDDRREGRGILVRADGSRYDGIFKDGRPLIAAAPGPAGRGAPRLQENPLATATPGVGKVLQPSPPPSAYPGTPSNAPVGAGAGTYECYVALRDGQAGKVVLRAQSDDAAKSAAMQSYGARAFGLAACRRTG